MLDKKSNADSFADSFFKGREGRLGAKEKQAFLESLEEDKIKKLAHDGLSAISEEEFIQSKKKFIKALPNSKGKLKALWIGTVSVAAMVLIVLTVNLKNSTSFFSNKSESTKITLQQDEVSEFAAYSLNTKRYDELTPRPLRGYDVFMKHVNTVLHQKSYEGVKGVIAVELVVLENGQIGTVKVLTQMAKSQEDLIIESIRNAGRWSPSEVNGVATRDTIRRFVEIVPFKSLTNE